MGETEVSFCNRRGERLAGVLNVPASSSGSQPVPGVVLCQGLSGVKHLVLPDVAAGLAAAGIASLRFDYAGHGDSEGTSGWVDPPDRVVDAQHALAFLSVQPTVDPTRLGVYGHSYGGPVAIELAARDPRVRAVVSVSGPGAGIDMLRAVRASWDWVAFKKRVDDERASMAAGGEPSRVPVTDLFPFSPEFLAAYQKLQASQGGTSAMSSSTSSPDTRFLASADAMLALRPDDAARHLGGCALLMVHGADDDAAPLETVRPVYANAPGPKDLIVLPGANHNDLDAGPGLASAIERASAWFVDHLRAVGPTS